LVVISGALLLFLAAICRLTSFINGYRIYNIFNGLNLDSIIFQGIVESYRIGLWWHLLNERMIEQSAGEWPLFKIFHQTKGDKVVESSAPISRFIQGRRRVSRNLNNNQHTVECLIKRIEVTI
jgi:hypothetical protein